MTDAAATAGSFEWAGRTVPVRNRVDDWGYSDLRDVERCFGARAAHGLDREDVRAAIIIISVREAISTLSVDAIHDRLTVGELNRCLGEIAASRPPEPVVEPVVEPGVVLTPTNAAGSQDSDDPAALPATDASSASPSSTRSATATSAPSQP